MGILRLSIICKCDWKLEKRSKLHIRRMVLKNSSQHNLPRIASIRMKFTQKMHQSITFQTTSSTCSCLYSFPPNKIENLSSWMSEVVSQVLTKGWGVAGWTRDRLQNGGRPRLESRHKITGLCWLLSG